MRQLRYFTAVVAVLAGMLTLSACGDDSDASPSSSSSPKDTKKVEVTVEGTTVTPNGNRVQVGIGQPVEFDVTADAPGEIHVHSDPEQELEYEKGTTILKLKGFDKAGIVEVESHSLEKTIVQLEVR